MKKSYYRTDFLFSKMSFWIGAGSILSLFTPYFDFNMSKDIDTKAIESDFGTIGGDIRNAIGIFEKSEL